MASRGVLRKGRDYGALRISSGPTGTATCRELENPIPYTLERTYHHGSIQIS